MTKRHQLVNNENGKRYAANFDTGFFQQIGAQGNWLKKPLNPVSPFPSASAILLKFSPMRAFKSRLSNFYLDDCIFCADGNFYCDLRNDFRQPRTVGSLKRQGGLSSFINSALRRSCIYFYLNFQGLFNQSFGEINMILNQLFGIRPEWFNDPFLAKVMILIVNTWLGYPYMMILCMGLLKAIPQDLYEPPQWTGRPLGKILAKLLCHYC